MDKVRALIQDWRAGKHGLRKQKLSRAALSALTHDPDLPPINPQTIYNIEKGHGKEPGFQTVMRLIAALAPPSQFFAELERIDTAHPPSSSVVGDQAVSDEAWRAAIPSDAEYIRRFAREAGYQLAEANRKLAEATEALAEARQQMAQAERDRAELPAPDRQPAARTYAQAAEHAPRGRGGHPRHVARKKTRRPRKR